MSVPGWSDPGVVVSLPGLQIATVSCVLDGRSGESQLSWSFLIRARIFIIKAPPSSKPHDLPKAPSPNTIGLRASTQEFGGVGGTIQSTAESFCFDFPWICGPECVPYIHLMDSQVVCVPPKRKHHLHTNSIVVIIVAVFFRVFSRIWQDVNFNLRSLFSDFICPLSCVLPSACVLSSHHLSWASPGILTVLQQ